MTVIIHDGFRPLQRRVPSGTRRGLSCEGQINGSGNADSPSGEISPEGFLFNRKLCSLLNKNAPRDAHSRKVEICRKSDSARRESSVSETLFTGNFVLKGYRPWRYGIYLMKTGSRLGSRRAGKIRW